MSRIRTIVFCNLAVMLISVINTKCDEKEVEPVKHDFKTIEVQLKQGVLSGKVEESFLKQKEYYAFRGIPFAEPPIGTLRFQPPKPSANWDGTYEAYERKPTCLQFCSKERNGEPFGMSGSEDCLYLSVFTPALKGNYPVVVFDYNDNFKTGFNGTEAYSPDFFIEEDVIVVTVAHRLGLFGYLTTEDDVIPCNNGMRDFILALNWIKNNIEKFGGDVNRITLMGNKGGAALANMLLYSKQAKGLFSAIIMQSGTATETAYFYKNPRLKAFEFGKELEIETEDSKTLLEELQKIDAQKLVMNEFIVHDDNGLETNHMAVQIFSPTIETEHENAIITNLPERGNIVNDVPVLIGFNSREGLDYAQHFMFNPRIFQQAVGGITMNLPVRVDFKFDRNSLIYNRNATTEINEMYYKDGYVHTGNILEFASYLGDVFVTYAVDKTAKTLSKTLESSVYYYMFDFRGVVNENCEYISRYARVNIQQWGATVTDELCYLHLCARIKKTYEQLKNLVTEQAEFKILKKMVRLWTNFAKLRNPTPEGDDIVIKGIKWEPINKQEQDAKFLHITKKFTMKTEPLGRRAKFWDKFLDKYSSLAVNGIVTDKEGEGYESVSFENMRKVEKENTQNAETNINEDDTKNNEENFAADVEYKENGEQVDVNDPSRVIIINSVDELRDEL